MPRPWEETLKKKFKKRFLRNRDGGGEGRKVRARKRTEKKKVRTITFLGSRENFAACHLREDQRELKIFAMAEVQIPGHHIRSRGGMNQGEKGGGGFTRKGAETGYPFKKRAAGGVKGGSSE